MFLLPVVSGGFFKRIFLMKLESSDKKNSQGLFDYSFKHIFNKPFFFFKTGGDFEKYTFDSYSGSCKNQQR